jgi:quercetin dioxygenase-like cupin family protein
VEKKEPYATEEEYKKRVIHYPDVPLIELGPGSKSHIVSVERITVSFVIAEPNICFASHSHEPEQIAIITDGSCDYLVDGKLYHLEAGDVLMVPSNVEHGNYILDKGLRMIEIFSPPRHDLVAKLDMVKKSRKT